MTCSLYSAVYSFQIQSTACHENILPQSTDVQLHATARSRTHCLRHSQLPPASHFSHLLCPCLEGWSPLPPLSEPYPAQTLHFTLTLSSWPIKIPCSLTTVTISDFSCHVYIFIQYVLDFSWKILKKHKLLSHSDIHSFFIFSIVVNIVLHTWEIVHKQGEYF